jgi:hypothetical protein
VAVSTKAAQKLFIIASFIRFSTAILLVVNPRCVVLFRQTPFRDAAAWAALILRRAKSAADRGESRLPELLR